MAILFVCRRSLAAAVCCLAMMFVSMPAAAQSFPDHPVQIVVPYVPGGLTDNIARYFAARLKDAWMQPVVVDNKPGASATLGAAAVARAPGDGHTLLLGSVGMATNPLMFRALPYSPGDLAPLALVALAPNVLYVHPSVPATNVRELVAWARANPGALSFASTGFGSSPHLAAELFATAADIRILHVPYKGTGAAINDFLGGQVKAYFDTMQSMRYANEGKIRALAVAAEKRLPDAPTLPTVEESGVAPGVVSSSWFGFFAPASVEPQRRALIAESLLQVARDSAAKGKLVEFGLVPTALDPAAFQQFLKSETDRWGAVIRARDIKVE